MSCKNPKFDNLKVFPHNLILIIFNLVDLIRYLPFTFKTKQFDQIHRSMTIKNRSLKEIAQCHGKDIEVLFFLIYLIFMLVLLTFETSQDCIQQSRISIFSPYIKGKSDTLGIWVLYFLLASHESIPYWFASIACFPHLKLPSWYCNWDVGPVCVPAVRRNLN